LVSYGRRNCFAGSPARTGGGGPGGFSSFTVQKLYDKSSPQLAKDLASGQDLGTGTVFFRSAGQAQQQFLTFKFTGLHVDGYRQGGHGSPLEEDVSLGWSGVDMAYSRQNQDGSLASPVHFVYPSP
jgi:type VI secretion system secreted protein Hcp